MTSRYWARGAGWGVFSGRPAEVREVFPRRAAEVGRFASGIVVGFPRRAAEVGRFFPRHSGRFSAARRGGREVSAKIVRFFRTALRGAEVARVRVLSLGPTIFRGEI